MKVALINPTPSDHYSPCIRMLTAYLKLHGHQVRQIFVPADQIKHRHETAHIMQLAQTMIDDIVELVADFDLVGVSFMTCQFDVAVQVTRGIQRAFPDKFIVWGGFHPTTMPQQALEFVDAVCVGEGEHALLELVERLEAGEDYTDVRNFWFRKENGKIVGNPHRPLVQDLDTLPYQDFEFEDDWTWTHDEQHMERLTWERYKEVIPTYPDRNGDLRNGYKTMITRGCPHKCSYCGVAFNHDLYKGQRYLRRRSVEHMVGEIKQVVAKYPEIGIIHFQDDVFFSTSNAEIKKFSKVWQREVGLNFRAQCSPTTINEEKYKDLIDAGLCATELGIQTGSSEIMRTYKRGMTNEQLLKAVNVISKYADYINVPDYHMILDNPWESTEDTMKGLRLLWTLPPPYNLLPSSLVPYPGTEFYHKAIEDGFVTDEYNQIYRKGFHTPNGSYLNFLFFLTLFNSLPKEVVQFLAQDRIVRVANQKKYDKFWGYAYQVGDRLRQAQKLSHLAVKGKLLEITNLRDLKRMANQGK
ncbi:MAG: radical SAM protein [Deltaproteobacteria bacterium]|nr:MAG: radical SAM protein [Deltaproteobacteria bacterium]